MIQDAGRDMAFQTYKDLGVGGTKMILSDFLHLLWHHVMKQKSILKFCLRQGHLKIMIFLMAPYRNMKNWDEKSTTSSKLWNPVINPNPVSCIPREKK